MMKLIKVKLRKTVFLLAVSISFYLVIDQLFIDDYYKQIVDLERVSKIVLPLDINTVKDFHMEGAYIWESESNNFREILNIADLGRHTNAMIHIAFTKEDAMKFYHGLKGDIPIQSKKQNGPYDQYYITKVKRLRASDFGNLFKVDIYFSKLVFVKNNLVVSINSGGKTGSDKQRLIDAIAYYLEGKALNASLSPDQ